MDNSLSDLYQDIILEHNKNPRNKHQLLEPTKISQGNNPSCGDNITVYVQIEDETLKNISFDGEGCAISQASASIMTELLCGKSVQESLLIVNEVCSFLSDQKATICDRHGEVLALSGVKKFPMRVKCATLAWHAIKDALS